VAHHHPQVRADLWLVLATAIWGLSFVFIKDAVRAMDPYVFLAVRFTLGALIFVLILCRTQRPTRAEWLWGAALGVFLWGGNVLQTVGIQWITPSRSAFLTSLTVILVPVLVVVVHRTVPPPGIWAAVLLAVAGLVVLYWTAMGWTVGAGDILTMGCAIVFAGHILVMNATGGRTRPIVLCGVQLAACAALMCVLVPLFARGPLIPGDVPAATWRAILWLGTIGTVIPFALQTTWQPRSTPARAAVIFTLEPVFATAFAVAVAGAAFTVRDVIGSMLILAGALTAELWRGRGEA
jgi:drug/metabolite transporter (DMT)-like permease